MSRGGKSELVGQAHAFVGKTFCRSTPRPPEGLDIVHSSMLITDGYTGFVLPSVFSPCYRMARLALTGVHNWMADPQSAYETAASCLAWQSTWDLVAPAKAAAAEASKLYQVSHGASGIL